MPYELLYIYSYDLYLHVYKAHFVGALPDGSGGMPLHQRLKSAHSYNAVEDKRLTCYCKLVCKQAKVWPIQGAIGRRAHQRLKCSLLQCSA